MTRPILYYDVGSPFAYLTALAAMRRAFTEGRDLAPREATEAAHARGVFGMPTVAVDDTLFWGDDRLVEAAAALRERD